MNLKRISAALASVALACSLMVQSASAAPQPGVYTAHVTTTYTNPDTGKVDDGGSSNAALGEGMCRSATAETALVEVDRDGNIWLTLRLLLQSNCKNVALYTRNGYDSYSKVSYEVTAEDSGLDSIDYRFKVTDAGVKMKATMYVTPMGRDVLWYLYVDTNSLTSGSGDFAVSIDLEKPTEKAPVEKKASADKVPAEKTPAEKTPAEKTPAEKTPAEKTPAEKTPAEKTPAEKASADKAPVSPEAPKSAPVKTEKPAESGTQMTDAPAASQNTAAQESVQENVSNVPAAETLSTDADKTEALEEKPTAQESSTAEKTSSEQVVSESTSNKFSDILMALGASLVVFSGIAGIVTAIKKKKS